MSIFTRQWDPEDVLEIGEVSSGVTCVAYASSKKRRCHNPIAAVNRERAAAILHQMSKMDVSLPRVLDSLERVGRLLLCHLKPHHGQISHIVQKWHSQIEGLRNREKATKETVAEWEEVVPGGPIAVQQWTGRLQQSTLNGDIAKIQRIIELLGVAAQREIGFQIQVADLETSTAELKQENASVRAQLATSANDAERNEVASAALVASSVGTHEQPTPSQHRTTELEIDVTLTNEGEYPQLFHGHCLVRGQRNRTQHNLEGNSLADGSQQQYPWGFREERSHSIPISVHDEGHVKKLVSKYEGLRSKPS